MFITGPEPRIRHRNNQETLQSNIENAEELLSEYQKLKNGLEKAEATISQMTLQQIKPITEFLTSQIKQFYNCKLMVAIICLGDDKINSNEFNNTLDRIQKVIDIIRQAQEQDDFMDGQEPTTNIEPEIENKISDEQSHQFIESVETENPVDDLLQEPQHLLIETNQQQYPTVEDITVDTIIQVRHSSSSS